MKRLLAAAAILMLLAQPQAMQAAKTMSMAQQTKLFHAAQMTILGDVHAMMNFTSSTNTMTLSQRVSFAEKQRAAMVYQYGHWLPVNGWTGKFIKKSYCNVYGCYDPVSVLSGAKLAAQNFWLTYLTHGNTVTRDAVNLEGEALIYLNETRKTLPIPGY